MSYDIGPRIGIEGEKEFKNAISNINKDMSVLGSEMGKVTQQFSSNSNSMDALTSKTDIYNKQIDEQKKKIETLKSALANANKEFGEGSNRAKDWQISLNKAEAELAKTESQLKQNEKAIKEYSQAQIEAARNSDDFKNVQNKLGAAFNAVKVAALAVGATIAAFTVKAVENADEIQRLSDVTGFTAEALQEFKYIGANLGVELDTITGAETKLIKSMYSAQQGSKAQAEAFKQLGINVLNSKGELRDSAEVMADTFEALKNVENPALRDALAMQIFGKSARDLNPLINAGAEGLNKLTKEARESGAVMSNEAIAGLDAFGDSIENVQTALTGKFGEAFSKLAPTLTEFTDKIKKIDITPLVDGFKWIIDNAGTISALAAGIGAAMLTWNVVATITAVVSAIKTFREALIAAKVAQDGLNFSMKANVIGIIITAVAALVGALVVLWNTNEDFRNAVTGIWNGIQEGIGNAIKGIVNFFTYDIPNAFNSVIDFFKNNWQTILTFILNPFAGVIKLLYDLNPEFRKWVDGLLAQIGEWFGGIADIGSNIVKGLWDGILSTGNWIKEKISGFVESIKNIFTGKEGFDEHSPSKWSEDVFNNVIEGFVVSVNKNGDKAIEKASELSKNIMNAATEWIEDKKFYNEISLRDELKYWETLKKNADLQSDEISKIDKKIYTAKQSLIEQSKKEQAEFENSVKSRADSLKGFAGIFDSISNDKKVSGNSLLKNLKEQVDTFKTWQEDMSTLMKKGISGSLLDELRKLGPSASKEIKALTTLSDEDLQKYVDLFKEKSSLAASEALTELTPFNKVLKNISDFNFSKALSGLESKTILDISNSEDTSSNAAVQMTQLVSTAVGQSMLAGFAAIADVIFAAIPKETIFNIDGKEIVKATWGDFDEYARTKQRLYAPTREQILNIARTLLASI